MEFGVLGPLEIRDSGKAIGLPRQRRDLLALLLCRPGIVVSADALVDGLWGEVPPRTAAKSLQVHVHHLRRVLDDQKRLAHRPPGYLLAVEPDELDAARFERLVERGRTALAERRTAEGVDLLRQALALWRGPAFAGLDHLAMAADEAQRLAEQRRTAEEDLLDGELDLGNHAEVVGRLTALVAEHPFQERPRAQLMLALHRLGRQAEALDVYREGRQALADDLGLEPGPRLRDLERAILMNDPALAPSRPGPSSPRVPAELPLDIATFTGRSGEVERLHAMLTADSGSPVVAAINGVGGSGKSALAVRTAHEVASAFPDGQLYVNLRGSTAGLERLPAVTVLGRWSRTLGENILDDVDEAAACFRSLTAGRKMLIVLDNAADAAQVRPLLPGGPGCAVLITSRRMLSTLDGAVHLRLDIMSETEALAVLDRLGADRRVAADPDGATRIAELCGRLPLALRIAGARLAAHPDLSLSAFADRLSDARRRLDELRHADLAVRTSFTAGLEGLAAESDGATLARTFALLGLLDGPDVSAPVVTAMTGLSPEHTRTVLERLAEAQLLSATGPGRYGMHDLVRLYARERAQQDLTEETHDAAWRRAMRHYLATCRSAAVMLDHAADHRDAIGPATGPEDQGEVRFTDRRDAIEWVDAEHDNLLAAVRQAATAAGDEDLSFAAGLSAALFRPFDMRGKYEDRVTVARLAFAAACRIGDVCAEAQALNDLGWACLVAGDVDAAVDHLERSVARWQRTDMRLGLASSVANLGSLYATQGRHERAIVSCRWSVEVFREAGDRNGEARALINLGSSHLREGRYPEAIAANQRSLDLHTELGHPRGQAVASGNLAEAHRLNGSPELAVPLFERAIAAIREVGDRGAEAEFHWFLGNALHALGHPDRARDQWRCSAALLHAMGALSADEAAEILACPVPDTPEPILRTM